MGCIVVDVPRGTPLGTGRHPHPSNGQKTPPCTTSNPAIPQRHPAFWRTPSWRCALQEAYLRAWRSLGSFRAEARLSTWLVRIVVNEALGRLRGRRSAQVIPLDTVSDAAEAQGETWMHADPDEQ